MSSKLTKKLYTDITRLKLLDKESEEVRFRLTSSPFNDEQDDDQALAQNQDEYVVIGQIFPKSEIFNERSYSIEMKLTKTFPTDPPEVRFLTPIYHPNVGTDGKFCTELLQKTHKWTPDTSLIKVIAAVVDHIDHPNVEYAVSVDVGKEYVDNNDEFKRKAQEHVREHGLPR